MRTIITLIDLVVGVIALPTITILGPWELCRIQANMAKEFEKNDDNREEYFVLFFMAAIVVFINALFGIVCIPIIVVIGPYFVKNCYNEIIEHRKKDTYLCGNILFGYAILSIFTTTLGLVCHALMLLTPYRYC
jgi:uncharacterized membrane protein